MPAMKDIIKQLRKSKKYSQADMAKVIGLSKSAISMYERGERSPDNETLAKYASHFGVDYNYLHGYVIPACEISEKGGDTTDCSSNESNDLKLKMAIFGGDDEVTDEMWEKVLDYAKLLKLEQHQKKSNM